jgi:hypothetical protein
MRYTIFLVFIALVFSVYGQAAWTIVRTINTFNEKPEAEQGLSRAVTGPTGLRYRETGGGWHDRYAYVVELPRSNLLVRVKVAYPDDRKRSTMISQTQPNFIPNGECWTCGTEQQELGSGMMTGAEYPLSGKDLHVEYLFHHRDKWLGIIVESVSGFAAGDKDIGRAAVSSIEIAWKPEGSSYGPKAVKAKLGAKNGRRAGLYWEDPVFAVDFGGLGGIDGPAYDREFARGIDYFNWSGANSFSYPTVWYNGSIYKSECENAWPNGYRHHPADFPLRFAKACSAQGITFTPQFAISKLPSLITRDDVKTVDVEGKRAGNPSFVRPPAYNALHVDVQNSLMKLVDEHLAMIGGEASFDGIAFYMGLWNLTQLGTWLENGFDDWTIGEFEKADPLAKGLSVKSFKERAIEIRSNEELRKRFTRFRASRMCDFYERVAAKIAARKKGARLKLMLSQPGLSMRCVSGGVFAKGKDSLENFWEMGLDIERLSTNSNIRIDRVLDYGQLRNEEQYRNRELMPDPFMDLDPNWEINRFLKGKVGGVTIHQYYFETHGIFARGNFMTMPSPWKKEAYGRCCAPLSPGREMLRYWARALELFDPEEINTGGFTIGTSGCEDLVREWTQVFQALPAVRFTDEKRIGSLLIRRVKREGKSWVYLLNTSSNETKVEVDLSGYRDIVTGEGLKGSSFSLAAFELRAFVR